MIYNATSAADPDRPLVGYHNVVTTTNIAADTAATGSPASNLANPATHLKWVANTTDNQDISLTLDGATAIDYVAIIGHNFGSSNATITLQATIDASPADITVYGPVTPEDDSPILFWVPSFTPIEIRIHIVPEDVSPGIEPEAAVVYAGTLLRMERKLYVDHTPISQARKINVSNGRSESGEFLGRIVLGEWRESSAKFRLITPEWYRANMPDFLEAAKDAPFVFAWRPSSYPEEIGYVWLTNDPMPVPEGGANNYIAFELAMSGVS